MLKVALTHDIDRTHKSYQYITRPLIRMKKGDFSGFWYQLKSLKYRKPYWTFKDFMEIEESYGIRSTVFFLNESIRFNPLKPGTFNLAMGRYNIEDPEIVEMIQLLDSNGWEIGVHGSYNSYKDKDLLIKEKQTLERIISHPVIGIRQHYLNLDDSTWGIQKEAGFKYDSSWGHTEAIGFKEGKEAPFYPFNDAFVVFPLLVMDTCFMGTKDKWNAFESIMDQCIDKNAILIINFHQHVYNQYDFPGFKEAYIEMIERSKARNAEFYTLSQLYESFYSKRPSN